MLEECIRLMVPNAFYNTDREYGCKVSMGTWELIGWGRGIALAGLVSF